ncbi:MAG: glycosyltransferase [Rubritepida sp.]|nr:glycosyltransferase [Rubritepida sp.]
MALLADLTDLLDFFEGNRTPLGVPRVEMSLTEAALEPEAPSLFAPIAFEPGTGRFHRLPPEALRALIAAARAGESREDADWIAARAAMAAARSSAPPAAFAEGDTVLTLGLPTHVPGQMRRLRELRRAHGVALASVFYDAIPLSVPEHCGRALSAAFAETMLALCLQVDRVVAISASAAEDFRTWQRRLLPGLDIPCGVMPLDAPLPPLAGAPPPLPPPLDDGAPFVLCVATIESRKNHLLLLHAWLTLLRRHGPHAVPRLVLAGRQGYGAEAALRLLADAPELRAGVTWLGGVSDALLQRLYRDCLFTVFNSFHEGWGLPVTEALSHGKLVITPDHSSLREAGGAAALYFTPQSEPELADLAWSLIRDPARRAALEAEIPARAPLRGWRAVAEGLVATLAAPAPSLPAPLARAGHVTGRRIGFERREAPPLPALPAPHDASHTLVMEGEGWSAQEEWGVWLTAGAAALRLPAVQGKGMRIFLEVSGPPAGSRTRVRAEPPEAPPGPWLEIPLGANEHRHVELRGPIGPAGDLVIRFDASDAPALPGESRRLALLLRGMMLCADDDHWSVEHYFAGRLALLPLSA